MSKDQFGHLIPEGFPGLPAGWIAETETFQGADGRTKIFSETWHLEPWISGRALFVVHGFGEHGGRYQHFPHFLKDCVNSVFVFDHRGHGRSEGIRGHCENFDQLVDDALVAFHRFEEKLTKKFGKAPQIHLFGHSMGGAIALRMLLKEPELAIEASSISAPFLDVAAPVPFVKRAAAGALKKIWGNLQLSVGMDVSGISRDPNVIKAYQEDRLVHDKMTPKFYLSMMEKFKETRETKKEIKKPIQFFVPKNDRVVSSAATFKLFKDLKASTKFLLEYSESAHEAFNDPDKEKVFEDLKKWINKNATA